MSKDDGKRYWRGVRCDGCQKRCRYQDFKILKGARGGKVFEFAIDLLRDDSEDSKDWKYKRRGTVLGILHEMKLEAWNRFTEACSEYQAGLAQR